MRLIIGNIKISYTDSKTFIPSFDGIRGISVMMVVLFHCFRVEFGWIGVEFFFVLSGFLITNILLDTKKSIKYFQNFYVKRALRIFPLYYFLVGIVVLPRLIYEIDSIGEAKLSYWFYLQNIDFSINGWGKALGTLNHTWSLAIEEQFYLFFPMLIQYCSSKRIIQISGGFITLALLLRLTFIYSDQDIACYAFTFCRIDSLFIGCLAAFYARHYTTIQIKYYLFLGMILLIFFYNNSHFYNFYIATIGVLFLDFFFAINLLICLDSKSNLIKKLFELSLFRILGKYSYGIYLYHWIFYQIIKLKIVPLLELNNTTFYRLLSSLFVVFLTILTSILSFHIIEKPFLSLKKKFNFLS